MNRSKCKICRMKKQERCGFMNDIPIADISEDNCNVHLIYPDWEVTRRTKKEQKELEKERRIADMKEKE